MVGKQASKQASLTRRAEDMSYSRHITIITNNSMPMPFAISARGSTFRLIRHPSRRPRAYSLPQLSCLVCPATPPTSHRNVSHSLPLSRLAPFQSEAGSGQDKSRQTQEESVNWRGSRLGMEGWCHGEQADDGWWCGHDWLSCCLRRDETRQANKRPFGSSLAP